MVLISPCVPVQLLFAVLQCFLQLGPFLAALLHPLLQLSILLSQSFTLLPALLQLGGSSGHSLSQLLILFLLIWGRFNKGVLMFRASNRFKRNSLLLIIQACALPLEPMLSCSFSAWFCPQRIRISLASWPCSSPRMKMFVAAGQTHTKIHPINK